MAIITYPLNGIEYSASDAETYLCSRTSGVYAAEDCFSASITGNREITISRGLAWIRNTYFSGKSVANTENVIVEIPIADSALSRIDRIVLRFSTVQNESNIVLKQGALASQPIAPPLERTASVYELGLCDISVPAGSIFIKNSDVISTLLDENLCGLMSDGVTKIPTANLYAKFSEEFETWLGELQEQFSGDVAANLQNQINSINKLIATYDDKYIAMTSKGKANGVASLNESGKVPASQLPAMDYIPTSSKGNANGVASLDSSGKVPASQLPASLLGLYLHNISIVTDHKGIKLQIFLTYISHRPEAYTINDLQNDMFNTNIGKYPVSGVDTAPGYSSVFAMEPQKNDIIFYAGSNTYKLSEANGEYNAITDNVISL